MEFAKLEPFGERRADLRSATIACMLANIHRDRDKHPQPFEVYEFMPQFGSESTEEETPVEVLRIFMEMMVAAHGGQDLRGQ